MTMSRNAKGVATVLAIGTANPPYCLYQEDFPETYFKGVQGEHTVDLKMKLKRICDKTMIRKRHVNEETLKENQNRGKMALSLDLETYGIPKLGAEAATKAIQEWGQPKSSITHVIFHTCFGTNMPGADFQLAKLLGLNPSVKRFMFYHNGCYAGGTVLRLAKDLAENNAGARVLAVCSEHMINGMAPPSEAREDMLVAQAIFGDGAAAVIVGADPILSSERPIFRIVAANQTILPDSEDALIGQLRETGFYFHISRKVPSLISDNIEKCLAQAFGPIGISDWNSLFWIAHTGGAAILNAIEAKLDLQKDKLGATRHVLSEYGNMSSPTLIFVLDEMRKRSAAEGKSTTGEGLEFGVLLGFGPGVTVETIVLQSILLTY